MVPTLFWDCKGSADLCEVFSHRVCHAVNASWVLIAAIIDIRIVVYIVLIHRSFSFRADLCFLPIPQPLKNDLNNIDESRESRVLLSPSNDLGKSLLFPFLLYACQTLSSVSDSGSVLWPPWCALCLGWLCPPGDSVDGLQGFVQESDGAAKILMSWSSHVTW